MRRYRGGQHATRHLPTPGDTVELLSCDIYGVLRSIYHVEDAIAEVTVEDQDGVLRRRCVYLESIQVYPQRAVK